AGSFFAAGPFLNIGNYGTGVLNVSNGAKGTVSGATIGLGPGSSGVATITGTGSSWSIVNNLIVGDHGTAHLTVSAGGAVSNTAG
uniref:hypothetical protein n=1 Tax=Klebsiella pneumoniae TaxID=573 RepID=UPI0013D17ECA